MCSGCISSGSCVCHQQSEGSNLQAPNTYVTSNCCTICREYIMIKTLCKLYRGCIMHCLILAVYLLYRQSWQLKMQQLCRRCRRIRSTSWIQQTTWLLLLWSTKLATHLYVYAYIYVCVFKQCIVDTYLYKHYIYIYIHTHPLTTYPVHIYIYNPCIHATYNLALPNLGASEPLDYLS